MTQTFPEPRKHTARELAERFNRSPRTIYRVIGEPREVYEGRARARHERIRELRKTGMSYREIAAEVGVTVGAVHYALKRAA